MIDVSNDDLVAALQFSWQAVGPDYGKCSWKEMGDIASEHLYQCAYGGGYVPDGKPHPYLLSDVFNRLSDVQKNKLIQRAFK